ncbi:hypothetical protein ACLBYD_30105 [Rhodococcus sp. C26F]
MPSASASSGLGGIVMGWGATHSGTKITALRPEDVTARRLGHGEDLAVDITAPYGWTIGVTSTEDERCVCEQQL